MIYKSKKGWLSALLFVTIALACVIVGVVLIYASIFDLASPSDALSRVLLAVGGVVLIALCVFVLGSYILVSYEITPEELVVRFGPIRLRYRLSSIVEAIPTRVPLGPGLNLVTSWDLVYIEFRGPSGRPEGWPLAISPANKTEFLRELAERAPGLATIRELV